MNVQSLHNVLIFLHASAATISFFAGSFLILSLKNTSTRRWFGLYWWSLVGMVILLAGAILVGWTEYSNTERIIFPALFGLGIYMLYRARSANRLLTTQQNGWKQGHIEHIGFTLISLFEGFIIVGGLNSGISGWLVAVLAVLGIFGGRWMIGFAQQKIG